MEKNIKPLKKTKMAALSGKNVMKQLPMALFAACMAFNSNPVYSEALQPTLDTLHNSGAIISSTGNLYPQSEFIYNEVTPSDTNNLAPNVVRYYNPNSDSNVHYYEINLKNNTYGTGSSEKYYKWAKDDKGVKLVTTPNQAESVLTLKYNTSSPVGKIYNESGNVISIVDEIYVAQDIKQVIDNKGTINSITSKFMGNTSEIVNSDSYNYSAILSEADGTIKNISSSFIGNNISINNKMVFGALIKSLGTIDEIKSEFIANNIQTDSTLSGGLIEAPNSGHIGVIQSDFINNSATSDAANIDGAVINNEGTLDSIISSNFLGNYGYSSSGNIRGGVIYNNGYINQVNDSVFSGNYSAVNSGSALGGAIFNELTLNIENTTFYGNYTAAQSGTAKGGAIYTNADMILSANGKTTEFTGNYILNNGVKENQAIYVANTDGGTTNLTLSSTNNGKFILNDSISGDNGYRTILTGDDTGNIYIFANTTNINLINNDYKNYDWMSLSSSDSAKYDIDINFGSEKADTFTLGNGSSGVVTIDKLNLIGEIPTASTVISILNAPDTIKLHKL